jgi:hypothetical protein
LTQVIANCEEYLNHWFGVPLGNPIGGFDGQRAKHENYQLTIKGAKLLQSTRFCHRILGITRTCALNQLVWHWTKDQDGHAKSVEGGTCCTYFIHGGKRAPMDMSALEEGPSIGLMEGFGQVKSLFFLSEKCLSHLQRYGGTLCLCIENELVNENANHYSSEYIN